MVFIHEIDAFVVGWQPSGCTLDRGRSNEIPYPFRNSDSHIC